MARNKTIIPKAPLGRIILNAGAKRVSAEAIEEMANVLNERLEEISRRAVEIAKHSGRKTIHDSDIKLATKFNKA